VSAEAIGRTTTYLLREECSGWGGIPVEWTYSSCAEFLQQTIDQCKFLEGSICDSLNELPFCVSASDNWVPGATYFECEEQTSSTTLSPTVSPTALPTDCIITEEWSQARADELCPGESHHAYGVKVCGTHANPDWKRRLDFALANQLWASCNSGCLYDYDSYNTDKPYAFKWTGWCYMPTTWWCTDILRNEMEQAHAYAETLCETTEPCVEIIEWTEEVSKVICPDGYENGDKGYGTATLCEDLVRLENGFYETAEVLFGASFKSSLANHMFLSCNSKCVYDIENEGVMYQWKEDCWEMQTDWACIDYHTFDYDWAMSYLDRICPFTTIDPVITPCVEQEQNWTDEIAAEICTALAMGVTNKGVDAIVCAGYEEYQNRLAYSLANRAFLSCDAWCVYDILTKGEEAFIWKSEGECYNPVTKGLCIWGNPLHRMKLKEYIENILCSSTTTTSPTLSPTDCFPTYTWDEDRAEEICPPSEGIILADKSYGVKVCNDAASLTKQSSLERSLANNFFNSCISWCVYDYDTIMNNIRSDSADYGGFVWKFTCWKWVTGWSCFDLFLSEFEEISSRALDQCDA